MPAVGTFWSRLTLGVVCTLGLLVPGAGWAQGPRSKTIVWGEQQTPRGPQSLGILGEVALPGVYTGDGEVTLQQVVQAAGGLTPQASPSVQIVRGERGGRSILFYNPGGRDVLQHGDFIVVEGLRAPGGHVATAHPGVTWLGFMGVLSRPVVVPVKPDQAQLVTMMRALNQTPELARVVRPIIPARATPSNNPQDPLPSGTILAVPTQMLVASQLPEFPPAATIPTAAAAETAIASTSPFLTPSPVAPVVPEPKPAPRPATTASTADLPDPLALGRDLPELPPAVPQPAPVPKPSFDRELTASPVPFSITPDADTAASPASLPIPGSRLDLTPLKPAPAKPSTEPVAKPNPTVAEADGLTIADDAELVGELDVPPSPTNFNLWQLLGIGGTIVTLVGIAVGTRRYMEQPQHAFGRGEDFMPRRTTRPPQLEPLDLRRDSGEAVIPPKPAFKPIPLSALLKNTVPLTTEAADLPRGIQLQQPVTSESVNYRVDGAHQPEQNAPHLDPVVVATRPTLELDRPSAQTIPRPHFRAQPAAREPVMADVSILAAAEPQPEMSMREPEATTADHPAMAPLAGQSSVERALSQLQRGRRA